MAETFWQGLDAWLVARMEELTGVGTVLVGDVVNPDGSCSIGGVVRTQEGRMTAGSHSDGRRHAEIAYSVWLGLWVTDLEGIPAAKYRAQGMIPGLLNIINDETLFDITGVVDGLTEVVQDVSTNGRIEIFLRDGGNQVGGIAVAVCSFTVTTEV